MSSKFTGTLSVGAGIITNEHLSSAAAVDSDKLQHLHKCGTAFGFVIGGTPTTREEIVYVCEAAAAVVRGFHCLLNVDGSSTSIAFDLKKNGTTILTGTVTITDSTGNRTVQDGTLSSSALVAGDVLSIAMTVSSSTGAQGPYAWAEVDELAG
jgi:hypothetical protein